MTPETTRYGWTIVTREPTVLVREYGFDGGFATTAVIGFGGGRLLMLSPPSGLEPGALEELSAYGSVVALVANNGTHHMGLAPCRAAFPEAASFASEAAARRIARKADRPSRLRGLDSLRRLVGRQVEVLAVPGARLGDVVLRLDTERGRVWCIGDFVGNGRPPTRLLARLLFRWSGSGPGFKVNRLLFRLFVDDRAATKAWFLSELEAAPPDVFIPAHGTPIARQGLREELRGMFEEAV